MPFVYPLIIKLGLLNGLNPSVCTRKEFEVLLTEHHLLQPCLWTRALQIGTLNVASKIFTCMPLKQPGHPPLLLYLGNICLNYAFFPLSLSHFMTNLFRAVRMCAPSVEVLSAGRLSFYISPEDILNGQLILSDFLMNSWKKLYLPRLSQESRML